MEIKIKDLNELSTYAYQSLCEAVKIDDDTVRCVACIAALTGEEPQAVWQLKVREIGELANAMRKIIAKPIDFDGIKPRKMQELDLNGVRYRLICDSVADMPMCAYVDFQNYIKDGMSIDCLPQVISCFYVPEGKEYGEGYDIEDTIDAIGNFLTIKDAYSTGFFLFGKLLQYRKAMQLYLRWQARIAEKQLKRKQKTTPINGRQ